MKNRKSVGWFRALAQQQIDISSIRPFFYFHHSISIQQQSILLWRMRLRVVCEDCEELTMLIEWDCVLRGEEIGRQEGQEDTRARTLIDSRTQTRTSTHRHAQVHKLTHAHAHTRQRQETAKMSRRKKRRRRLCAITWSLGSPVTHEKTQVATAIGGELNKEKGKKGRREYRDECGISFSILSLRKLSVLMCV